MCFSKFLGLEVRSGSGVATCWWWPSSGLCGAHSLLDPPGWNERWSCFFFFLLKTNNPPPKKNPQKTNQLCWSIIYSPSHSPTECNYRSVQPLLESLSSPRPWPPTLPHAQLQFWAPLLLVGSRPSVRSVALLPAGGPPHVWLSAGLIVPC